MNKSKCRQDCERAEALFAGSLMSLQSEIENKRMLVVGVAGNPLTHNGKPGLDNPHWYPDYNITTLDFDEKWSPDIVGDITRPLQWIKSGYHLIHITQVIEHIPNIFDLPTTLAYSLTIGGYVIIDCPFGPNSPPYHAEPPSFGDYWRISKDGMKVLFEKDFDIIKIIDTDANTSCLMKVKS